MMKRLCSVVVITCVGAAGWSPVARADENAMHVPTALVRVSAKDVIGRRDQRDGPDDPWRRACDSPCGLVLPLTGEYRINGGEPFALHGSYGGVAIEQPSGDLAAPQGARGGWAHLSRARCATAAVSVALGSARAGDGKSAEHTWVLDREIVLSRVFRCTARPRLSSVDGGGALREVVRPARVHHDHQGSRHASRSTSRATRRRS